MEEIEEAIKERDFLSGMQEDYRDFVASYGGVEKVPDEEFVRKILEYPFWENDIVAGCKRRLGLKTPGIPLGFVTFLKVKGLHLIEQHIRIEEINREELDEMARSFYSPRS